MSKASHPRRPPKVSGCCPFCGVDFNLVPSTADHVFQDFLGGRRTIRACKPCNDRFGHSFEGQVSKELAGIIVILSRCGYEHPRLVTLKSAWTDPETQFDYDVNSTGQFVLSKPFIERGPDGEVTGIHVRSEEEARQLTRRLYGKGVQLELLANEKSIPPPPLTSQVAVSDALKKLAAKICIATARLADVPVATTVKWSSELLVGDGVRERVRRILGPKAGIPGTPALSHAVQIEANGSDGLCKGIVQIFGAGCVLHVVLDTSYSGPAFAFRGVLNTSTKTENFGMADPIDPQQPPIVEALPDVVAFFETWPREMNRQIVEAFGDTPVSLSATTTQRLPIVSVSLPLLWTEFSLELRVSSSLRALGPNHEAVTFPRSLAEWHFRGPDGSPVDVFADLQARWDTGELSREEREHEYNPSLPGGTQMRLLPDHWMAIEKLRIRYRVHKSCWVGAIPVRCVGSVLNLETDEITGNIRVQAEDVPRLRDPSWRAIENADRFERKDGLHLVVENASVNFKGSTLSKMTAELSRPRRKSEETK